MRLSNLKNPLNVFESTESIWLNWIILKWLNLFETIFKLIDYKSQEQQWRKIFPVKFQKVEFPAILKLKSGFYTAKNIKKTFYDFFPIFPSNTFGNPFDFTRVIEFPIIYREKSLKNPDFFFPSNRKVLNEIKINFKLGIFVKFQKLDFFPSNFENWNFFPSISKDIFFSVKPIWESFWFHISFEFSISYKENSRFFPSNRKVIKINSYLE